MECRWCAGQWSPFLRLRSQVKKAQFSVEVPEVTGEITPAAIVQHDRWMARWAEHGDTSTKTIEYRWYGHRLYVRPRLRRFMCLREGQRNRWATINDVHQHDAYRTHDSREAAEASLHRRYEDFVLIDGHLYEEIGEPRYVISTFGLGCNHGLGWGTSMGVDHYYNSNISKERYFRIDKEEECRQERRRIAERRGDAKAFPHFDKRLYERFTILLPEAVRLDPKHEHGDGDPFINKVNVLTEVRNPVVAGLGMLALALR